MKPIQLKIPNYFDHKIADDKRLKLVKAKPLLPEDDNSAQVIASIERVPDYQCDIPELSDKYNELATKFFHRDRKEGWELANEYAGCKVYTYNWDDEAYSFRIYWFVINEEVMLQLVSICEPKYANFYKQNFMLRALDTEIDKLFDYSKNTNPSALFDVKPIEIPVSDLQELIDSKKAKEEKAQFLAENLKVSNPNFFAVLEAELKEKEFATIQAFLCTDWNMYYNLYNPENFSNPDSTIEWESNADDYEYYEKPLTNNTKTEVYYGNSICNLNMLHFVVEHKKQVEQVLLNFFENYTFGNGGAYADAIHFEYAKIEIERLHKTTFTNQEFLKRNLCLASINILENPDEISFQFHCSWDTEHGIEVVMNKDFECWAEY